jgi:hypothetical protein
LLRKQSSE